MVAIVLYAPLASAQGYAWLQEAPTGRSVGDISAPVGFARIQLQSGSFEDWLRKLPLKRSPLVHLYDGSLKGNQTAQYAVIDLDVGNEDLQQCADSVIRLRAEYLHATRQFEALHFNFTSGDRADYSIWRKGYRPALNLLRTHAVWKKTAKPDASYASFRQYLHEVMRYAGTASLERELQPVGSEKEIRVGDVFIHGGSPGHAVLVVDVAANPKTGQKAYLLAQSFMPAQEMHVLRNTHTLLYSPWYVVDDSPELHTPEYDFKKSELRRF